MKTEVIHGDSLDVLKGMEDNSIDAIVTDPPYGLSNHRTEEVADCLAAWARGEEWTPKQRGGFMGKSWDSWVPGPVLWRECLRVLKPGGHMLVFSGTRTLDLMSIAIRLAGFEIRDTIMWVYGSGFPKSHNVANAIDKQHGAENRGHAISSGSKEHPTTGKPRASGELLPKYEARTEAGAGWDGWGTALKPALEPITVARKPLEGTVADNVQRWGTGGLNIDAARVSAESGDEPLRWAHGRGLGYHGAEDRGSCEALTSPGRWPANLAHDGSEEVVDLFPLTGPSSGGGGIRKTALGIMNDDSWKPKATIMPGYADSGSAARFFYCAKASRSERDAGLSDDHAAMRNDGRQTDIDNPYQRGKVLRNHHATVKPIALMEWLIKLVLPPGGVALDPFAGSGTTGCAAARLGVRSILIEREAEYVEIARRRIAAAVPPIFREES